LTLNIDIFGSLLMLN